MKNSLILVAIVITFQSCITPLYVPNTANTPSLLEKNEIELGGYLGSNTFGLQSAFAVSDNISIMLNGSLAQNHNDSTNTYREHRFIELGVGYTKILNDNIENENSKTFFTGYAGYGIGTAEGLSTSANIFNGNSYNNISSGNYYRIFGPTSYRLAK